MSVGMKPGSQYTTALNRTQVYSNVNRTQQPPTEWYITCIVNQAAIPYLKFALTEKELYGIRKTLVSMH